MRTRASLWMPLKTEGWLYLYDGSPAKIHQIETDEWLVRFSGKTFLIYSESVVLTSNHHNIILDIIYRMVSSVMTKFHFYCLWLQMLRANN